MKSVSSYIKFGIPGIVFGIIIATGVQFVFSWTGPTQAPPNGNTDAPINVSAVDQTKAGSLTLGVSVLSPIFYDANNTNYYIDPTGVSVMSTILNQSNGSSNWGLITYGAGWADNFYQPQTVNGSIYTNDVYLRSIGRWASQLYGGGSVSGQAPCPANSIPVGSGAPPTWVGPARHGEMFEWGAYGMFYCFDGKVTFVRPQDTGSGGGGGGDGGGD